MKLGTLLLRNAAIGLSQLEGALRNQVLYGGRLGTNLVELGYLDLELLSAYLAELAGVPIATAVLLDAADPTLLERLGASDAHRLRAIPIGYLGDSRDTAAVAFVDPDDTAAIEQVAARLGVAISPHVVPEARALFYLEKHYGLPRRARFLRPARPARPGDPPEADRSRSLPPGMMQPPPIVLEPRRKPTAEELPDPGGLNAVPVALTLRAACERIDAARHRDQIASVFVDVAQGRCDALVVFLIRDGNAIGWRGYLAPGADGQPGAPRTPIEELSLPLGGASSLQAAYDSGRPYAGPPPSTAHPVETRLWLALGVPAEPKHLIVVPVSVRQRTVNLIYAHTFEGARPEQFAAELAELGERAQSTYLRLIRAARGA